MTMLLTTIPRSRRAERNSRTYRVRMSFQFIEYSRSEKVSRRDRIENRGSAHQEEVRGHGRTGGKDMRSVPGRRSASHGRSDPASAGSGKGLGGHQQSSS